MYNFIDVVDASEENVLPSEALKINGEYIENLISGYRTLNVSGREALSPDVVSYTTGIRDGSRLKSRRYPERIITVNYQLIAESNEAFREAYNKLGGILNVENAELIFNDEQDKYFTGTPCTIGSVKPGVNSVNGSFEILCTDPFKYSVYEHEAVVNPEDNSAVFDYGGTYKAYPTLEAKFYKENEVSEDGETTVALTGAGECGYVAFFNENEKIVQIGDPDEPDIVDGFAKSQTLVNHTFATETAWGTAAKSQWKANSGMVSDPNSISQTGSVAMGEASPKTTANYSTYGSRVMIYSGGSYANRPVIYYYVYASTSNRTATTVDVTFTISAALQNSDSFMNTGSGLRAYITVGSTTKAVTLKSTGAVWRGKAYHSASIGSFRVTGLTSDACVIKGVKFRVNRTDSYGSAGVLKETTCSGNIPVGTYRAVTTDATHYLTVSNYGTDNGKWHGPSITRVIPADAAGDVGAKNFTLSYAQKMSIGSGSGATNQLGAFQVLLVNGSGSSKQLVAGVNVYKGNSGKNAKLRFYINNSVAETMDIDLSYNNKYFNADKSSTISKSGQTVTFNICGVKKTFRDVDIADVAVTEVTFTMTKFGAKTPLSYNGLYWVKFVKNNCDTWKDIPNKFSSNDVVVADCRSGEIYHNGVLDHRLGALGNDWEDFYLTPGLNQIGVAYSEWVEADYAPSFKIRYREVFL